jgi:hypothetical protein
MFINNLTVSEQSVYRDKNIRHSNLNYTFHSKDQFVYLYMMKQHVYIICLHLLTTVCKLMFKISEYGSITQYFKLLTF